LKRETIGTMNWEIELENRKNLVKILAALSEEKEKYLLRIKKINKELADAETEICKALIAFENGQSYRLYDLPAVKEGLTLQPKLEIPDEEVD
jgi:hypothetical protein